MRGHYETMHRDKYDAYKGKVREEKVKSSEMIAKLSRPFTEGLFIKECLIKASDILCPGMKKLFEGISLSPNTVASRVTDLAANVEKQLSVTKSLWLR